jgi:hypothetical protein
MPTMPTTASKGPDHGLFFMVAPADHVPTTADHEDALEQHALLSPQRRQMG